MSDDMAAELHEIGHVMIDELVLGIGEFCASNPNPLLTPERNFFRQVGSGLQYMRYEDLLTLCAAAITRIAFEGAK